MEEILIKKPPPISKEGREMKCTLLLDLSKHIFSAMEVHKVLLNILSDGKWKRGGGKKWVLLAAAQ